jgi:hypothetical protein
LQETRIAYLATKDHFDPGIQSGFQPDGHYTPSVDAVFADAFLKLIAPQIGRGSDLRP